MTSATHPTESSSSEVIRVSNAGVSYRRRLSWFGNSNRLWALSDVSMSLHQGETLGVIGANGAGKSTLLRLLAGIIQTDRGTITRTNITVSLLSLQVGFIPDLSGRDNAILSGMLLGLRKRGIIARLDEIIEFSELGERILDPIRTYSTGMRARLGFAVALAVDPDVLLIDEVLGVGDADFAQKSRDAMQTRIQSNRTVVLVTHSESLLRSVCDRAILLHRGRTIADGDLDTVLLLYRRSRKKAEQENFAGVVKPDTEQDR